jgi:succinate dehydrogenase / fumarate reductase iron-sulfur subunit
MGEAEGRKEARKAGVREVIVRVHRYNPETGKRWIQEYKVPVYRGMTVLDVLLYIKSRLDPTLSFRYSCRMGVCGSCGVLVNGMPRLACQTQVMDLLEEEDIIEVAPLPGYPVVRDLIVDMTRLIENRRKIRPYIIRRDMREVEHAPREFIVYPEEHLQIYQYTLCIMCGLCNAACPVFTSNPNYLGPQALTQAYRFIVDVRDEATNERIAMVANPDGCFGCHFAASCSAVCPKAVDPAGAIQRLRTIALKAGVGLFRKRIAKIAPPLEKPLRHIEAKYPTHNLVPGSDPEAEAKKPVPEVIDPENPPE